MDPIRPITELEWQQTPEPVRQYIRHLERSLNELKQQMEQAIQRIEQLEIQVKKILKILANHRHQTVPLKELPGKRKKERKSGLKAAKRATKPTSRRCLNRAENITSHLIAAVAVIPTLICVKWILSTLISISSFPKSRWK